MAENHLLFQMIEYSWLSVPDPQPISCQQNAEDHDADLQPESCQHDAMDHDAYPRCESSSSVKPADMEQDPYAPINYIRLEAFARLAAAEESAARCADAMDASVANFNATYRVSSTKRELHGCHDPLRTLTSMAPPKKFYRACWLSMSLRLLHRWTQEAKSSCASYVHMVA
jgi:hypothetical protein